MQEIDWVSIPPGVLVRGTSPDDVDAIAAAHASLGVRHSWILKEAPRSEVQVGAFFIGRVPVTVATWAEFARDLGRPVPTASPDHPIDGVAWADANRFCRWLSERMARSIRLPTETEWERAARGGDGREYPWGDTYEPGRANLADICRGGTTPVGSFPAGASPFGVLDLAGNVDEWTATPYAPYPGAHASVPAREDWAFDEHITRGGAYFHQRDLARCARRHGVYPPLRGAGFRVVST